MDTQFDELLAKHLNGSIQEDEKKLLAALLKSPENQLFLAAKIDQEFLTNSVNLEIGDDVGDKIFHKIKQELHKQILESEAKEKTYQIDTISNDNWFRRRLFRWVAAAAIVSFVVIAIWINTKQSDQPTIAQGNIAPASNQLLLQHVVNTTGKDTIFHLPDGSIVTLANKSEISYQAPFTNKRNITLIGKAYFKVVKDKTKPFTVVSRNINTTALGTEFQVTAYEKAIQQRVRLYEGKVVIQAVEKGNWRMKRDVYLLPGQEFIYSDNALAKIRMFTKGAGEKDLSSKENRVADRPSIPFDTAGNWYMFNNESLGKVIDDLAVLYGVEIIYNKKDLQKIYFTGKYNKSDSLNDILKRIAIINGLQITKRNTTYTITK